MNRAWSGSRPSSLLKAARILGVSPSFFFNGLKGEEIPEVERLRAIAAPANDNAGDESGRRVY